MIFQSNFRDKNDRNPKSSKFYNNNINAKVKSGSFSFLFAESFDLYGCISQHVLMCVSVVGFSFIIWYIRIHTVLKSFISWLVIGIVAATIAICL